MRRRGDVIMRRLNSTIVELNVTLDIRDPFFESNDCQFDNYRGKGHRSSNIWIRYSLLRIRVLSEFDLKPMTFRVIDSNLIEAYGYDRGLSNFWLELKLNLFTRVGHTKRFITDALRTYINNQLPTMLNDQLKSGNF